MGRIGEGGRDGEEWGGLGGCRGVGRIGEDWDGVEEWGRLGVGSYLLQRNATRFGREVMSRSKLITK